MWTTVSTLVFIEHFLVLFSAANRAMHFFVSLTCVRQLLQDSWSLETKSAATEHVKVASFGKLCVRCILHLLGKEKYGREAAFKGGFNEIADAFADDLQKKTASAESGQGKKEEILKLENLVGAKPFEVALLQHDHLQIGKLHLGLVLKLKQLLFHLVKNGSPTFPNVCARFWMLLGFHICLLRYSNMKVGSSKVFELVKCEDDGFTFVHSPFFGPKEALKVAFEELSKWKKHKGGAPTACSKDMLQKLLVHNSVALQDEMAKCTVQKVLLETCQQHTMDNQTLLFTQNPTGAWAAKNLKKGELKLYPAGTVSKLKQSPKGKLTALYNGQHFAIASFARANDFDEEKGVMDPFFWVKSSSDPDEVTMVVSTQVIDKVQLPLLTNAKALKAGEQLVVLKPSEENQEAAASGSAPQAKKRKTTK